MAVLGFIGMGNMGYALLKGCKNIFKCEDIIFYDNSDERMNEISQKEGISSAKSNGDVILNSKYIVLAVKPQVYDMVISDINEVITEDKVIISLAPGITIAKLEDKIKAGKIVRTMPNTPAMAGAGMTGVSYKQGVLTEDEEKTISDILSSVGKVKVVDEKLMNSVVCASGSSPAYVFVFIEALADSAVQYGMPRKDAYEFVAQTVMGSAKLMLETKKHPGELKDMICSPGGTTMAGVAELEKNGFRKAIYEATKACFEKCDNIK